MYWDKKLIVAKVLQKLNDGTVVSVIDDFLSGHCHEFAISLHRVLGYKLGMIKSSYTDKKTGDKKYVLLHAYAVDDAGQAYDINGKYSVKDAVKSFKTVTHPDTGEALKKVSFNLYNDEKSFRKKLWTIPVNSSWIKKAIKRISKSPLSYSRDGYSGSKPSLAFNKPKPFKFDKTLETNEEFFPSYNPKQEMGFNNNFNKEFSSDETFEKIILKKIKKIKFKNKWKIQSDHIHLRFPYIHDSYEKNKDTGKLSLDVGFGNLTKSLVFSEFKIKLNNNLSDKKSKFNFIKFINDLGDFVVEKGITFVDEVVGKRKKAIVARVMNKLNRKKSYDMDKNRQGPKKLYHVTNIKNMESIKKTGLTPSVGEITDKAHGSKSEKLVYLLETPASGILSDLGKDALVLEVNTKDYSIYYYDGYAIREVGGRYLENEDIPVGVEEGDFYSYEIITPSKYLDHNMKEIK